MATGAPYSPSIVAGDVIYLAGQLALDEQGNLVGENDVAQQTTQALANLKALLEKDGFTLNQVTTVTVYLQNIETDFAGMNEAYRTFFGDCKPARATVEAKLVHPKYLVELTAIAARSANNMTP